MIRRQPRSTRTDPLCPYPPLFQSRSAGTAISPMESDSMRVAVSAGEAAGIVETVPNGCGRTPGGGPGRTGQSVGASAVPAKPGRGRGPDRDSVADQRRQRGGALAVLLAAVAQIGSAHV